MAPEAGPQAGDGARAALRGAPTHLRDRLPPNEAAQSAAQLPTLVCGLYHEGRSSMRTPEKERAGDDH
jgi:uncharacterized protein (DUF2267 family)